MSKLCVFSVGFSCHWTQMIQLLENFRSYLESTGVYAQLCVWLGGQCW